MSLPVEKFNDIPLRSGAKNYTNQYGVVCCIKGCYVVYGKYRVGNQKIPAGVGFTGRGTMRFRVKDMLERYPTLYDKRMDKTLKEQEKW